MSMQKYLTDLNRSLDCYHSPHLTLFMSVFFFLYFLAINDQLNQNFHTFVILWMLGDTPSENTGV